MKITRKTKMAELLKKNPESAEVLFESGMMCIGCPMSMEETIEQGCLAHGMDEKQVNEIVEKINKKEKK